MTEAPAAGVVHGRLSDLLRERRDEILAGWETAVRKVRAARNLDRPLLLDHMPHFLADLAGYVDDVRAGLAVAPPEENPRLHAVERLELGYDLSEVVIEYAVLRQCITELVARSGTPSVRSQELPRLHSAIDQAIATSVVRYTAARERTLRALDRISSAALTHHEVEKLLPATLNAFLETTASVDAVALALPEKDGALRVRAAVGYPDGPRPGTPLPPGGFAERVLRNQAPIFLRDARSDPQIEKDLLCAPGTHALYGVPLPLESGAAGVAVMGSRASFEFAHEDQFLFRTMVARAAALIAQARLDAEVERRAAELEAVIESIPEAVYVGDENGVKRTNRAGLEMVGFTRATQMLRGVPAIAADLDPRRLDGSLLPDEEHAFARALRGEKAVVEMVMRNGTTGKDVVVRSSAAPIRLGERIVGAVAVNTDITARMREEDELRAAVQFRDRILGVLSHDLRNPLSVILTSAAILRRGGSLDEKQAQVVQRLINNARRIERMVHDLLDYTRARQGRGLPVSPRDTDLLALCTQVIDGLHVLHPGRALRLSSQGSTRAPVDPERAEQVLGNLLSNALRYSPEGTPVEVALRQEDGALVMSVHNQGSPIPPETIPRLFEAFQRGVSDESGRSAGLGLGLYIVQQIVAAHGGSVEVRSDAADGTTFSVRWPLA